MRDAFAKAMTELAGKDERIVLLSGDIGNRMFDEFKGLYPDRFYNCGVAEANMTGLAAGLALSGMLPVTYTIAPFNTYRCFEQIRLDLCYHNLPVIVVGVGAGLAYAGLGATHHSCEDIASLRALPNMNVICPGDAVEVRLGLAAAFETGAPTYLRLGKKREPVVHASDPELIVGKAIPMKAGDEVCILNTGNTLPVALNASEALANRGVNASVYSMHTVKPLDTELLAEAFASADLVVTVEEHGSAGGLGGAVAEWLSDHPGQKAGLLRNHTGDTFLSACGNQDNAREILGLTPEAIADAVIKRLGK